MKFISMADSHIRSNRPQFRKDKDYLNTCLNKFQEIITLANQNNADILHGGDFFDSPRVSCNVINKTINIIKKLKGTIYTILGQHDLAYHTENLDKSPVQLLMHTEKVILLKKDTPYPIRENYIYGCSFDQEPIEPKHKNSILVIHKSITPKEPPFFLPDAISAKEALNKYKKYNLIISGDFHEPFSITKQGHTLINCGPMMRQSIDQTKLKPRVWLIDTLTNKHKPLFLTIEPSESVFAFEDIKRKEDSKFSKNLNELVETLKNKSNRPNFQETVKLIMHNKNISKTTRDKIDTILGEII